MPDKLKKLETLLSISTLKSLADKALVKEDVLKIIEALVKVIKDTKDTNLKEWKLIHEAMKKIPDRMMDEMMSSMSATEKKMVKDCYSMCEKMCAEMEKKHKAEMGRMDLEVRMIKADREAIIEDALAKVPLQVIETPEQVRDKLEQLEGKEKLSIQAIDDLPKMLEDLGKRVTAKTVSGGLISKRIRFVDDETPSGTVNGTNKEFTITRAPETGSLKVYVNGQRMRVTEDFTFSHKTITFVTAPPTGSILLVDFRF